MLRLATHGVTSCKLNTSVLVKKTTQGGVSLCELKLRDEW